MGLAYNALLYANTMGDSCAIERRMENTLGHTLPKMTSCSGAYANVVDASVAQRLAYALDKTEIWVRILADASVFAQCSTLLDVIKHFNNSNSLDEAHFGQDEYRLLSDLRHNYDPYERPVANSSEPLVVSVKIYLQQILDVDEKNQVITLVAWIEYQWTDYKLKWHPSEYGGIKDIRIPGNANAIWRPDVLLYNSADENFDSTYPVNYVVSHTGHVLQVPPGILKLSCKIDITYFPFDDQMCHLKFGSWTYSGNFIDLRINGPEGKNISEQGMDISYYVENGEWNLLAVPARNETNVFDDQPYPSIYFYLIIQRRTLYYGLNLIIPSLLISLMTVLGFTLPPDAGEKITLGKCEEISTACQAQHM
ncbi:hypothetical protein KIN20_015698 [Parelaphostrongylus tenuis]|uniref:Neurotransmitter-gated ion-channel ligand-binding domain-containing protein n=1 Tax=Parelaphostrongylus tenuis TaxID=148309 RepID=A0AAD5MK06_PARTN|nr:hypothetical protein KIN20_015698 [Parelaphostrongylus tenuis]